MMTYGEGFQKINALVLRTLYIFEPNTVLYDPSTEGMLEEGQAPAVDPADPLAYQTVTHWPAPLPDRPSDRAQRDPDRRWRWVWSRKRGALKSLGEEFPDEKAEEIFEEMKEDVDRAVLPLTCSRHRSMRLP